MRDIAIPSFYIMPRPINKELERVARTGVRLIELYGDEPDGHIDLTDHAAVTALARVVKRLPLEIHSVHCAFSKPDADTWDITHPDTGKREAAIVKRAKVIESSAILGAQHVVMHGGAQVPGRERLEIGHEGLLRLVETARKNGMRIAIENLPSDFLGGSLLEVAAVLENLDPQIAGLCLDTGHALLGKNTPVDFIRTFGTRLFGIHWHSNDGKDDQHLFPGTDWRKWDDFFIALDEVGYDSPITIEAVPPKNVPLKEAMREARIAVIEKREPRL